MSTRNQWRALAFVGALLLGLALLTNEVRAEHAPDLEIAHASGYGAESIYDGGYWSNDAWQWTGYYGARTSWGWHCARPEDLHPDSPFYTWAILTPDSQGLAHQAFGRLGTWVDVRLPRPDGSWSPRMRRPVTDAGPFGVWWDWDLQDGLVRDPEVGWDAVAPSRYDRLDGLYFGRRDIQIAAVPDAGRFCPRLGYWDGQPAG
jgi:hypothetical protein